MTTIADNSLLLARLECGFEVDAGTAAEAAECIRRLLRVVAVASAEGSEEAEIVRHVKSGGEYRVFPLELELQSSGGPVEEGAKLTMYVSPRIWRFWARPTPEFRDGRFMTIRGAQP